VKEKKSVVPKRILVFDVAMGMEDNCELSTTAF
jgi:hypothetical protein